jgi:hypothetical protein
MIRKVYKVDPLICPSCGGQMRIISFTEEPKTIDRINLHLELTFGAEQPPPPHHIQQDLLKEERIRISVQIASTDVKRTEMLFADRY